MFAGKATEFWVGLALATILLALSAWIRRRSTKTRKSLLPKWVSSRAGFTVAAATAILILFAILQPHWGERKEGNRPGHGTIWLCLDVSRSMLVEDCFVEEGGDARLAVRRLESAKRSASHLVDSLEGHPVGVVAFAGDVMVLSPPTEDHDFVRSRLSELDTESAPAGGTNFLKLFAWLRQRGCERLGQEKEVILLFTDGGHDSDPPWTMPIDGCLVTAIGCGRADEAGLVPSAVGGPPLRERGQMVTSRLREEFLRSLARTTGGTYLTVEEIHTDAASRAPGQFPDFVRDSLEQSAITLVPALRFHWFLIPSFLLVLFATLRGVLP